ncbi:hypothetical protein DSC45_13430 [Streptomyces sp. YIM 130001]|uniref:hypothetical protein n=1 Tax=Streptomyces sp. YIM 130001 TaxID=2259644 RepID=UPI000ECD6682|nr:hypothetical protein [Streptomyces sp. YIM 130001]RII17900.1 hypothetical protein DSC45_13430 [Streptomyces sp. YIM 130001]
MTVAEKKTARWFLVVPQWWKQAFRYAGPERHVLLLGAKSTLAAALAWTVSFYFLEAQSPAFAPFSAVTIMYVTVYQSVAQALRYVGAVVVGVAAQAALAYLTGPDLLTFVLVTVIALAIGRSRLLGVQGPQVATAAFFAFAAYSSAADNSERLAQLGQIVLLVVIGCAIGIVVTVVLAPPLRYRSAEYGVRSLARELYDLTSDVYPALRDGAPDAETTGRWRQSAARLDGLIADARAGLNNAKESVPYNPRRLLKRHHGPISFRGYEAVLNAVERTLHQLASLVRSLDQWKQEENDYEYHHFLNRYAAFLEAVSETALLLSTTDEKELRQQTDELTDLVGEAQTRRREVTDEALSQRLPLSDPTRPYGVLVVEATRLMEEIEYTNDTLCSLVEGQATS